MTEGSPASRTLSSARIWLSLSLPSNPSELEPLVAAAISAGCPIDVSSQPALWGHYLRGSGCTIAAVGGVDITTATSFDHAADLVYAKMLETLCSIGSENIECFFLPLSGLESAVQLQGAIRAVSTAKAEGNLKTVGLYAAGNPDYALQQLQRYEVFEVILAQCNHSTLELLDWPKSAHIRSHASLVTCSPFAWSGHSPFFDLDVPWPGDKRILRQQVLQELARNHPVMVGVRTASQVEEALAAFDSEPHLDLYEALRPFREGFEVEEKLRALRTQNRRPA
jgi:hypothetical protein